MTIEQRPERRFDQIVQDQGGQRDVDLNTEQLSRQIAQRAEHDGRPSVARIDGALNLPICRESSG